MSTPLCVFLPGPHEGVGVVRMQDAAGKNAMTERFVHELVAAFRAAEAWAPLRVLVLQGLPDMFSTGAHVGMLRDLVGGRVAPSDILLPKVVFDCPVPVVAAMEGHAIGGGLALGLCADMVVIARESRYGATFMNMGFTPGMGMTRLLTHVLSPALAHELLFTGELKRGSFFEGKSGFNAILPRVAVLPAALDLAARVADKPRVSLEMLKRTLSLPRRRAFEETHTIESLMHRVSFASPEVLARIEDVHAE
ncbi:MAG: enoyl-CoA hydratase/isomerase family protein [Polyangiaceae bacterium]|nr:enoyl-CoA hydratase/isomerase family protein [Polyangiaceae bacterium]